MGAEPVRRWRPAHLPAATALHELGGLARWHDLAAVTTQHQLRRALDAGQVVRAGRGRYALANLPSEILVALCLRGVVSHASAARLAGLALVADPAVLHVTVRRGARPRRRSAPHGDLVLHEARLTAQELAAGTTGTVRTVLDCAAVLPFEEALAVADSALRLLRCTGDGLVAAAVGARGPGAPAKRRVAAAADGRAANPFESALRGTVLAAGLTGFVPQVPILTGLGRLRVDLADVRRRIVLEADSLEWHGSAEALDRDCRRYDELAAAGWQVLRFSWGQVMRERAWVATVVRDVCAAADRRTG